MRFWKMALMGLATSLGLAAQAEAQTRWDTFENVQTGYKGALVCPVNDRETGNYFCFMVGCQGDGPLLHRFFFVGGDLPQDLDAQMVVDGKVVGRMAFSHTGETEYEDYVGDYDLGSHGGMIAALKSGRRADLVLQSKIDGAELYRARLTLKGSSKALDFASKSCALPAPPPIEDPLAAAKKKVEDSCSGFQGSTVTLRDGAMREEDFDRDGLTDQIIDYSNIICDKVPTLLCGSAGCPMEFYRQQAEGGFVRVGGGHMYGYSVTVQPVITLNLHGSACGKVGAAGCTKSFTIKDNKMVPLQ